MVGGGVGINLGISLNELSNLNLKYVSGILRSIVSLVEVTDITEC